MSASTMAIGIDAMRHLLEAGALAPSGDNLQPWIADWRGDTLHLAIDPARDRSLYNFRYHASHIALGAMIENIAVASRELGLVTTARLSASSRPDILGAALTFGTGSAPVRRDPLYPFLATRCTNRRPYKNTPVPADVLEALRSVLDDRAGAQLVFVEDPARKRTVANAASLNDRLLFEIEPLHRAFFESMRWTSPEAEASRDGLFVKTLELGPMAPAFRAFRRWSLVNTLNKLGNSRLAPMHSYQTFMRSPALGYLQLPDPSLTSYVEGGRMIQRIWLTATSRGLSFQPMAGMLYLLNYLSASHESIGPAQRRTLERAEKLFKQVLPLNLDSAPIMAFRIGYADGPSARSMRRPLGAATTQKT